jgi:hypothetical protein
MRWVTVSWIGTVREVQMVRNRFGTPKRATMLSRDDLGSEADRVERMTCISGATALGYCTTTALATNLLSLGVRIQVRYVQ